MLSSTRPEVERAGIDVTLTVADWVELLFAEFGSVADDATVAALAMTAPVVKLVAVCAVRVTVADPALAIVPRLHVTLVVPVHEPCEDVTETNVRPAGKTSLTTTLAALLGPALLTVIV